MCDLNPLLLRVEPRAMACVCLSFFYSFQCGYFLSHPVCRSQSTSFCISLWRNWFACNYLFRASVGLRKIQSLLLHHLAYIFCIFFLYFYINSRKILNSSSNRRHLYLVTLIILKHKSGHYKIKETKVIFVKAFL